MFALAAAALLVFVVEMYGYKEPGGSMANVAAAVFALVYVGLLLSFAVGLRMLWGVGALASLLIVVKMSDVGAYTVGRLVGRHKMAPTLSPSKTMEGAIGAVVFALAASWATFQWLVPIAGSEWTPSVPRWGWIPFGLLVGAAGLAGDLAESLIKRDVGKKDSSHSIPGFGGVLDILDSVLFAAPVAYGCWWAFFFLGS
jgi:phosphatidate cytidylyltransferase